MSAIHFGKGGMGFGMIEGFASKNLGRRSNICILSSLGISDTFMFAIKAVFGPESAREHCWLRIDTLEGNTASGVLDADTQMAEDLLNQ